ncbi:MAG: SIR2 family protein [Paramuribaculum sp.]|nr:SIR2 family protein [Paramuribaculum sp.]
MNENRFLEIDKTIDSSMRMKLNQIRSFLDLRKASVMVGAGFSKNAAMGENVRMKDWSELCEDFYTALYDSKPSDRDFRLKSALRLAQQIESTMGRIALDEIIKNSLPNASISPGYLHELLVSLNWRDIFTTNYDSLLEEAAVKAYRHYNVVTSKDSLIYQPHPRIVKLHGSFPDNRPFIITEEDYRTYPERFPEFVNTIRQALIETQFCLIGFSGDDPNFLSWLGWFRDIMGNQMLPIYMIYVGSRPHDSEVKLLSYRKVEPIITKDISEDPVEAMDFILSYVGNKFRKDEKWNGKISISPSNKDALKKSIPEMRKIRESYPDWIILPADKIENEFNDCRSEFAFIGNGFLELEDADKMDFLYEYTWRLQTSFMPSWLNTKWYVTALQEIMDRYDSIDTKEKKKADYLSVALLQIYRIIGDERFKTHLQLIRKRISPNNASLHRKLNYEETLWLISHCEFSDLEKVLDSWRVTPEDYRGTLWKSKILMEIDKSDEALKILEEALGNARRKLMSNSKSEYQLSAITLLSNSLTCIPFNRRLNRDINEKFRFKKYYELCLKEIKNEKKVGMTHTHGFNIGTHRTSWNSGSRGYIEKYVGAGRYYLITEAYGQPIGAKSMTYNSNINQLVLPLITEVRFNAALSYLVESNDKNALKSALSRQEILNISEEDAINLFDIWIKVLEPNIEPKTRFPWNGRERNVVLPLLVRLCVWLNFDRIFVLIKYIWNIYDSYHNNISELLTTCYNSLPLDKAVELWWKVMNMPIILDERERDIIKPMVHIKEWMGNDSIVDIITNGIANDSLPIRRAAIDRFCDIHTILPKDAQEKIDNAIIAKFDSLLNTNLISILGVDLKPGDNRIWKDRFISYLNEQVVKFIESDFKISGSSVTVSAFDDQIVTFIDCCKHLTQEETNGVLKKILDFVNDNYTVLRDTNDADSLFGGLKRFLDLAMEHINIFIAEIDDAFVQNELRNELLDKIKLLSDSYPLIRAVVRLSFIGKSEDKGESVKENRQFIRNCLERDVISSDHNRMEDSFLAAAECQQLTKGNFSIQEIVKSSIDHIRYHLDSETKYILLLLPIWITSNVIMKQNLRILFDVLSMLPQRITDAKDIAAELKSDMLYFGGQLAGQISKVEFIDVDKTKCVESWQSFANSNTYPHDIRNGYFKGQW